MKLTRIRPVAVLATMSAVAAITSACGSASDAPDGPTRTGAIVLGCQSYCRSASATDAQREIPQTDRPIYWAARWVPSRRWAPAPDGTAPISVRCNAGVACRGALFVTIYNPTQGVTAPPRIIGQSDLQVAAHTTRTIGVPLDQPDLRRVRAVVTACDRYLADATQDPPDPSVGLTVDARPTRDQFPPSKRRYLTWVSFDELVCSS